ncbi:preprotein translocase subunit SecA [Acidiferrimicrobium sp. IK]|uniref:preprotein translocase subunit SecA n=1 Tax=Acidiferrimicrobium sp. IK TaxID=2871700 RepID=UPI0021CB036E|nr:preprotein translocase subunit SecA [Acidiferrimicrobium sp. IK]MCU4185680.1 preprotein translocase subunit SecA [Acidiferrimicrobium sp. IK]
MSVFTKILRAGEGKKVRALQDLVPDIGALEPDWEKLSDDELAHKTVEFRERLDNGEDLNDLLIEAFATVREAAKRTIGQRHFDVQLMGGAALHFGWIAEMKTGEGKTLVSTLPVYLNALAGKGVHVVTVNDYLAKFHADWMGQVHRFLGLSVGRVSPEIDDWADKKAAYLSDVTYGTNTEMGFDYLRDHMARAMEHMVQRGHHYAIVDEVDSILIDEARTPLIISGPSNDSARLYYQFAGVARSLVRDVDYEVDEEKRTVSPTEEGIEKVERALGIDNLYDLVSSNYVHQLTKALQAKELYRRDKDYIIANGEVQIVDEFTGRVLEGRRWSDGLHQAVEAKERVQIKEENHTWATVTLQNYFRLYDKLAGMTGTAETEASEFANTYKLPVVPIPTNRKMIRVDAPDLIYKSENAKFEAIIEDIVERREKGQPVLVGTASVAKSEVLSGMLERRGIAHHVLNAKQHAREAQVITQAGRLGAVTVATNMAGRGVDILLGGNPEGLAAQEVVASGLELESEEGQARYHELLAKYEVECKAEGDTIRELGGLYVLGSERHESRRIDNQLRGRAGRQGDPGESRFFLSLEDELMRLFATGAMSWVMGKALPDDLPIDSKMVSKAIERAQNTVEGRNAEIRKDVLKYDEVMNEQRKVIYARRMQILEGEDLRERTIAVISSALDSIVMAHCVTEYPEDWNVEGLLTETKLYFPTTTTPDAVREAGSSDAVYELLAGEAIAYYEQREESMPGGADTMRSLERDVMLQLIDQKWREHLSEMDYLREGIGLRAMGQQDPLVAWQREGYEMFGQLMASIDDDYVKIVMHAQVQVLEQPPEQPALDGATYQGPDGPQDDGFARVLAAGPAPGEEVVFASGEEGAAALGANVGGSSGAQSRANAAAGAATDVMQPIVKTSDFDNVGRNDVCPCGSGKKFKFCHGRA